MQWIVDLQKHFTEKGVTDVFVNGNRATAVLAENGFTLTEPPFQSADELRQACQDFAHDRGCRLDPFHPATGGLTECATLRWHCIIAPMTREAALFALRRHKFGVLTLSDFKYRSAEIYEQILGLGKEPRTNIFICGPTGSGKSSFLCAFLQEFARNERVVLLEETPELPLLGKLWVSLHTNPAGVDGRGALAMKFLLEETLRIRPDRIVLGELRQKESQVFFDSLYYGHNGTLITYHALDFSSFVRRIGANLKPDSSQESVCITMARGMPPTVESVTRL